MAVVMAIPTTVPFERRLESGVGEVEEVVAEVVEDLIEVDGDLVVLFEEVWRGLSSGAMIRVEQWHPMVDCEAFQITSGSCDGVLRQHIKSFWKC